jgi:hypothetical protein
MAGAKNFLSVLSSLLGNGYPITKDEGGLPAREIGARIPTAPPRPPGHGSKAASIQPGIRRGAATYRQQGGKGF